MSPSVPALTCADKTSPPSLRLVDPDVEQELEAARHLARHGVPVFIAHPALRPDNTWDPHGGTGGTGYDLPAGWQHTVADPAVVDTWRPGDALCAVMGQGIDLLDIDPRNGGDASYAVLAGAGALPRSYGHVSTPSGGAHDFIAALGVRSRDHVMPGIDVKAGLPDGTGRGFGFLPPTRKASKVDDTMGTYRYVRVVDLDALDGSDDTGTALAERITAARTATPPNAVTSAGPSITGTRRQRWAAAAAEGELRALRGIHDWPVGHCDERGRGWQKVTADAAYRLGALIRMDGGELEVKTVRQTFLAAAPRGGGADERWATAIWDAQWRRAEPARPPTDPEIPDEIVNPQAPTTAVTERTAAVAETSKPSKDEDGGATAVVAYVHDHYTLAITPAGEPYAVPLIGARLPVMLGERGGRLRDTVTAALFTSTRRVPSSKAVDDALRVIVAQARTATVVPLHLRVASYGTGLVLDLAQPGSGACVHLTPDGWTVLDNPPDGVLFRRTSATRPLPTPARRGSLEPLRELLGLAEDDRRWHLVRGWQVAALRPDIARPMLAMIGQPGSGKSTRGRLAVSVLDPTEELGSGLGRNLGDDQVRALARYLVSYDNLGSLSEAAQDHLCRLVSGEAAEKRQLYSDGDLFSVIYRRTGVLTAVALPAMRPDTLERIIPIHLERFDGDHRRGESELVAAFTQAHPPILGGLCDAAVTMLAGLSTARTAQVSRPRWADYYDTLSAYDPTCASAYLACTAGAMTELAEDDPFIVAVRDWLASLGGSYSGDARTAWRGAGRFAELAEGLPTPGPWWPRSDARFSAALEAAAEPMRAVGITVERKRVQGSRVLLLRTTPAAAAG